MKRFLFILKIVCVSYMGYSSHLSKIFKSENIEVFLVLNEFDCEICNLKTTDFLNELIKNEIKLKVIIRDGDTREFDKKFISALEIGNTDASLFFNKPSYVAVKTLSGIRTFDVKTTAMELLLNFA